MKNVSTLDKRIKGVDRMTSNMRKVVLKAFEYARKRNSQDIDLLDLFLAIISEPNSLGSKLLEKMGVDIETTRKDLESNYDLEPHSVNPKASEDFRRAMSEAFLYSSELGHVYVGTEHALLSMMNFTDEDFIKELNKVGINEPSLKQLLLSFGTYQPGIFSEGHDEESMEMPGNFGDKSQLGIFARVMNDLALEGKFLKVWGREEEIERLIHILSRKTKNNPILVGESGVGKTAVVEGLVQRIMEGKVPYSFRNKKVVQLDLASIIAGSKIRGDVEERILAIVNEVSGDPNKILFIDEIHMIVGAGSSGQGSMDVANILKPHLTTGDLNVIGATTYDEYQKYFESDDALSRRFQPVPVKELTKEATLHVIYSLKEDFENFHNVSIEDDAIVEAVELSDRYISDRYFPDKVIDIIDEAAAGKKIAKDDIDDQVKDIKEEIKGIKKKKDEAIMEGNMDLAVELLKDERKLVKQIGDIKHKRGSKRNKKYMVRPEDVRKVIAKWTKIPVDSLSSKDLTSLSKLANTIKEQLIGQNHAVDEVVSALKRSKVGINDENRPLGVFMFLGPTGVGKTELAKILAKEIFGREEAFIQVDMSEFMEQHSVAKLIGSPPGYIGYQEGGQLTEQVRRNPYSLVLFDEIEKAHPDLLSILLQIMEEGSLKDSKGRNVNFKNTIIILTSNIGAAEIKGDSVLGFDISADKTEEDKEKDELDEAYQEMKEKLTDELKDTLAPEFLNRLDGVIIFKTLTKDDIKRIVKIHLGELSKRLQKKKLALEYTQSVLDHIAEKAFNEEYGGRNVRRTVQQLVENEIVEELIEKKLISDKRKTSMNVKLNISEDKVAVRLEE